MKTTPAVEDYEMKIGALVNEIAQVQAKLSRREGIRSFSRPHPELVKKAASRMSSARKNLSDAIRLLLESGNP